MALSYPATQVTFIRDWHPRAAGFWCLRKSHRMSQSPQAPCCNLRCSKLASLSLLLVLRLYEAVRVEWPVRILQHTIIARTSCRLLFSLPELEQQLNASFHGDLRVPLYEELRRLAILQEVCQAADDLSLQNHRRHLQHVQQSEETARVEEADLILSSPNDCTPNAIHHTQRVEEMVALSCLIGPVEHLFSQSLNAALLPKVAAVVAIPGAKPCKNRNRQLSAAHGSVSVSEKLKQGSNCTKVTKILGELRPYRDRDLKHVQALPLYLPAGCLLEKVEHYRISICKPEGLWCVLNK
mmetsp:Transcript_42992/g.98779  ORF Transcript_42992/g.98779 Transcript_42992/m.98779 type:complete len:296 (+) Transcript_42992:539-1426(+)